MAKPKKGSELQEQAVAAPAEKPAKPPAPPHAPEHKGLSLKERRAHRQAEKNRVRENAHASIDGENLSELAKRKISKGENSK